ncbi:MAG: TPM domain-containing protein [Gemmatimonadetes bacterium]|nr:TPM domain-containing protein [Gemmatimonadota bacterium]
MRISTLALLACALAAAPAAAQTGFPEWNGRAVQDLAGVLSPKMEDSVRTLLAPARSQGIDVRVVTLASMADYDVGAATIEDFSRALFNAWRVGDRPQNDGVLLVIATKDRKLRIQLGDGAARYQDAAQRIITDSIVPHFREGKTTRGILRGTAGIAQWFTPEGQAAFAPPPPPPTYTAPQPAYSPPAQSSGGSGGILFALLGAGGLGIAAVAYGGHARNKPRKCPRCSTQMVKLDEVSDDVYLDSGQKCEEYIHSVDYDVWKCGACGTHTLLRYASWFSGRSGCPSCRYQTVTTSRHVLEYATHYHEGREEVTRSCAHCGFRDSQVVWLPRLPDTSSSSSSSSSLSSSSSSSSWSSSSSSSSGGGYSSGGGASGSW